MKINQFLRESAAIRLISTASRLERSINHFLARYRLSFLQSLILVAIFFEEDQGARPTILHGTFHTTKGNISHCLSRLEELKLVKRLILHSDKRAYSFKLTKKGEDLSKKLIGYFHRLEDQIEESLVPATSQEFGSLLTRVI